MHIYTRIDGQAYENNKDTCQLVEYEGDYEHRHASLCPDRSHYGREGPGGTRSLPVLGLPIHLKFRAKLRKMMVWLVLYHIVPGYIISLASLQVSVCYCPLFVQVASGQGVSRKPLNGSYIKMQVELIRRARTVVKWKKLV
jgi:hypothetical protein